MAHSAGYFSEFLRLRNPRSECQQGRVHPEAAFLDLWAASLWSCAPIFPSVCTPGGRERDRQKEKLVLLDQAQPPPHLGPCLSFIAPLGDLWPNTAALAVGLLHPHWRRSHSVHNKKPAQSHRARKCQWSQLKSLYPKNYSQLWGSAAMVCGVTV